jgi:hypothetical protein
MNNKTGHNYLEFGHKSFYYKKNTRFLFLFNEFDARRKGSLSSEPYHLT